jgi:hypothetical protein
MEGSFKRGWGADFYDEPGWQAALAGLAGSYRLDILRAGLLLIKEMAASGDQGRVRELAVGIAAALDAELKVQPGPVPWFLTDLRRSGARGVQRQGLYTVEEVVHRLDTLLTFEAWELRERRLESARKPR